jgi:hypothetical protein
MTRSTPPPTARRHLTIDLLALDLTTCGRCTRTEANLDAALETAATRLRRDGVEVEVRKTVVKTAEQAERLHFASSPTIRIDGRDIALELRESDCGDCGDLCACAGSVACRIWVWKGQEHLEAPHDMIVDALMTAYREGLSPTPAATAPFVLPQNLRHFFDAKAKAGAAGPCCEPACCGGKAGDGAPCCEPGCCGGKHDAEIKRRKVTSASPAPAR